MDSNNKKQSTLAFTIDLDESLNPEKITLESLNYNQAQSVKTCKALLVSLWDGQQQETMKIDLWVKDMQLDEMYKFYYQTLHTMADTLQRATQNEEAAHNLKAFANMFGENTQVVTKIAN
jgi:gliding motility-associated protein GldC